MLLPVIGSNIAQAYEKECDPEDPELCSYPITEGETSPFSGQLLTTKLAIKLGQKSEYAEAKLDIELSKYREIYKLDLELQKKISAIDREACEDKTALLTKRLEQSESVVWYKKPGIVSTVTVVLTVAAIVGGAYISKSTSD